MTDAENPQAAVRSSLFQKKYGRRKTGEIHTRILRFFYGYIFEAIHYTISHPAAFL